MKNLLNLFKITVQLFFFLILFVIISPVDAVDPVSQLPTINLQKAPDVYSVPALNPINLKPPSIQHESKPFVSPVGIPLGEKEPILKNLEKKETNITIRKIWAKSFGSEWFERSFCSSHAIEGGYIIGGITMGSGDDVPEDDIGRGFWIIKIRNDGIIIWSKRYGGSNLDIPSSIIQTPDKGFLIAGISFSNDGDLTENYGMADIWVVKISDKGDIQWQKTLGGSGNEHTESSNTIGFVSSVCAVISGDGGYIISGVTNSNDGDVNGNHLSKYGHPSEDFWVIKLSSKGDLLWQKCLGGSNADIPYSIIRTNDNGFIIAGMTNSNDGDVTNNSGTEDGWIIKIASNGKIKWQKCFGGAGQEIIYSIIPSSDGGYLAVGESSSSEGDYSDNHGNNDYWILKLDSVGNIEWQKLFGGPDYDIAFSVKPSIDNSYWIFGTTQGGGGDIVDHHGGFQDGWIIKVDKFGQILWKKCIGGSKLDFCFSGLSCNDGGFLAVGSSDSNDGDVTGIHGSEDYWVIRYGTDIPIPTPTITSTMTPTITPTIVPSYGSLSIFSSPKGANISLDYLDTGKVTPATISDLTTGSHTLLLNKTGYVDYIKPVTIKSGKKTTISAKLSTTGGKITILSKPTGANIFIDNINSGFKTSKTISGISIGQHIVTLHKESYKNWTQNVTIIAKKTTKISATLTPESGSNGSIIVTSYPSEANISIDGSETGFITPKTIPDIPAGHHIISLYKEGYQNWSKTFTMKDKGKVRISGKLKRVKFSSNFSSSPMQYEQSIPNVQSNPALIQIMNTLGQQIQGIDLL